MPPTTFASSSVPRHLVRGALGLLALIAAILGTSAGAPAALALLVVTAVAWRGCPTCWAIGLVHTRDRAACVDGCPPPRASAT